MKLWCVASVGNCNTKIWHQTSRRASDYRHKNITRPTFPASALRHSETKLPEYLKNLGLSNALIKAEFPARKIWKADVSRESFERKLRESELLRANADKKARE